ncbi:MAG TPA: UDP-N-acetylmuramoyl-L-alanine--D-glutamate ligase [Gammaproteobacteria bacterium]|nr:UDP-N-acetylmuramoyl-L-alanine--D-glutamate ligase [Gammaproteobacteria bacterium]
MTDLQVVVGLGETGLSCARYFKARGLPFAMLDSRLEPPHLAAFQRDFPGVKVSVGQLNHELLSQATRIILSPGVALSEPAIVEQIKRGTPVMGDIELFAEAVSAPVIAITGTNAKSTVTTLVGLMAKKAGKKVQMGGNLGTPALDLLADSAADLFVLELSSFQLETTTSLKPQAATVLNISPDHMDRYHTLADYQQAKLRVYQHAQLAVCNRDDSLTECPAGIAQAKYHFTLQVPRQREFGLSYQGSEAYLAHENQLLLAVRELPVVGKHYQANALAALAIGHGIGLPLDAMLAVLREFQGLPHRCQFVREWQDVRWYNDSKGTNVGATLAAIEGLGSEITGKVILIAGGLGKNADFNDLLPAFLQYTRHVVLIGEAANEIAMVINGQVPVSFANNMAEAVQLAAAAALPKDSVLLSPACASLDMFKNYEHRGDVFMAQVQEL